MIDMLSKIAISVGCGTILGLAISLAWIQLTNIYKDIMDKEINNGNRFD